MYMASKIQGTRGILKIVEAKGFFEEGVGGGAKILKTKSMVIFVLF